MTTKYKFKKYNPNYTKQYSLELKKLTKFLGRYNLKIEHFGSSAVPNLGGKGVIDIIIKANKSQLNTVINLLTKNKYELRSRHDDEERVFFLRKYKSKNGERFIHIHLTTSQKTYEDKIKFRDYLINNKTVCAEYTLIKKHAAKNCKNDGHLYQKLKSKFVAKIMRKITDKL